MKDSSYREALAFGWRHAWQHPFLWVYGVFAAIIAPVGMIELFEKMMLAAGGTANGGIYSFVAMLQLTVIQIINGRVFMSVDNWVWILWLVIFVIGLVVCAVVAATISQGALIHAAAQGVKKGNVAKDAREWHAGAGYFWRLFGVNAIKKIIMVILGTVIGLSVARAVDFSSAGYTSLFILMFLLTAFMAIILSFLVIYTAGYIVVEEYSFGEAIAAAWRMFVSHWLVSIELGAIFFAIELLVLVVVLIGFFLLLVPAAVFWLIAAVTASKFVFYCASVFLLVCLLVFMAFVGSLFTVFATSVWTHLFMKMHRHGITSRLVHWFN